MKESIHRFGANGQRLFGIVAEPEKQLPQKIGVIFSGPGLHYHGFYFHIAISMAREFARNGYYTFRYDPKGVGDSDGEFSPLHFKGYFNMVERGMFVPDHIKAAEFFRNLHKLDKVYTVGLCGGGITGLIAANKSKLLDGVVSISAPVWIHSAVESQSTEQISRHAAESEMKRYASSIFSYKSLWKFLTFRAEYRKIFNVLRGYFVRKGDRLNVDTSFSKDGLNMFFVDSFWNLMEKKCPVLIVLAEYDTVTEEYHDRFARPFAKKLGAYDSILATKTITRANHKYSDTQSQVELSDEILAWLKNQTSLV